MGLNANGTARNQIPDMGPQDAGPAAIRGVQKIRKNKGILLEKR
jgi:hypothetical protein